MREEPLARRMFVNDSADAMFKYKDRRRKITAVDFRPDQTDSDSEKEVESPVKKKWRQKDVRLLVLKLLDNRKEIHPTALDILSRQEKWCNNTRKIADCVESLVNTTQSPVITPLDLPVGMLLESLGLHSEGPYTNTRKKVAADFDRLVIDLALTRSEGNLTKAAEGLKLDRSNLKRLMRKYSISLKEYKVPCPV